MAEVARQEAQLPEAANADAVAGESDRSTAATSSGAYALIAGAAGCLPPAVRPRDVIALQRAAGNGAVASLMSASVQRDPPKADGAPAGGANPPLNASQFTVNGAGPTVSGATTAAPGRGGHVKIQAGSISLSAEVLASVAFNPSVSVGFIQTAMHSSRSAVYGKGGAETSRATTTTPQARDVETELNASGQQAGHIAAGETVIPPAPFFRQPVQVTEMGSPYQITFKDQPSFPAEARQGDSVLMGSDGQDAFTMSVGAKSSTGEIVEMKSYSWGVDWKQTIDSSQTGHGGKGITWAPSASGAPIMTDGVIARNAGHAWYDFQSQEAAAAAGAGALLANVTMAKAAGADAAASLGFTVAALRQLNPAFHFQVQIQTTSSLVGKDKLNVTVAGTGQTSTAIEGKAGSATSIDVNLLTLFANPLDLDSGTVTVTVAVTSDWRAATPGIATFTGLAGLRTSKTVTAGSSPAGTYVITASY